MTMLKSVEGVFKDGKVVLLETPADVSEARVIVTFLPQSEGQSNGPNLTPAEVAELRGKLAAWEEDWNAPGMEKYDSM
jgi:hypothetical protein